MSKCPGKSPNPSGGPPLPFPRQTYHCQNCGAVRCSTQGCSNQNYSPTGINCLRCGDARWIPT